MFYPTDFITSIRAISYDELHELGNTTGCVADLMDEWENFPLLPAEEFGLIEM